MKPTETRGMIVLHIIINELREKIPTLVFYKIMPN